MLIHKLIEKKMSYSNDFSHIDATGIEEAKKYINASFNKGLDISPDGLENSLKDFIALYCSNKIFSCLETKDANEICRKCFYLSLHLENSHNMFKYFGYLIKMHNQEDKLHNNLFFFIHIFEEMVVENKANLPAMISYIGFLEDSFYRIHRQNRIGQLQLDVEFYEKFSKIQKAILLIDLDNNLSNSKVHNNPKNKI